MYLKGDQSVAYWSAVAQIVPVLALAMAIEARILAMRWRKKKNLKLRGRRWLAAGAYTVLVGTLPLLIFRSVQNVARTETSPFDYWLALLWITACTVMVAYIPAAIVINTALIDMYWFIGRKMPWSKVKRLERLRRAYMQDVLTYDRQVRSTHIDALIVYADYLLKVTGAAIVSDKIIEHSPGSVSRELRRELREFDLQDAKLRAEQFEPQNLMYADTRRKMDALVTRLQNAVTPESKWAERDLIAIRELLDRGA